MVGSQTELDFIRSPKNAAAGGAIAGALGGVLLAAWQVIMQLGAGHGFWAGFKGASAPFFHERAMQPGFDFGPVLVGVVGHFAIAIAWGILFGLVAYGLNRSATVIAGFIWGFVVWVGMFYVVLPLFGMSAMVNHVPLAAAILEHVAFGLVVGIGFLPFQSTTPRTSRRALTT